MNAPNSPRGSWLESLTWSIRSLRDRYYSRKLTRHKLQLDAIASQDTLIAEVCDPRRRKGRIRANQVPYEIGSLIDIVAAQEPQVAVEIGTSKGGTLYFWSRVVASGGTLISIDMPGGPGSVTRSIQDIYESFGSQRDVTTHALAVDSHSQDAQDQLAEILQGRPIDFLFIDGDHSYEGAKADFFAYSRLMAPNGIVAMHDIAVSDDHPTIAVGRLWREITDLGFDTEAIVSEKPETPGIGVVALETSPAVDSCHPRAA